MQKLFSDVPSNITYTPPVEQDEKYTDRIMLMTFRNVNKLLGLLPVATINALSFKCAHTYPQSNKIRHIILMFYRLTIVLNSPSILQ